ncbi:MAG: OmpH family outer membrane protein [Deltaproteobacteria bacterium]|nr:OmpH family outer membrane protein [Deltaproteobacteria bacterium]
MKKTLFAAGCAVAFVAAFAAVAEAEAKFGFIDMQRALNEVEEGKKAKAKLKKDFDEKQSILDGKQDELKKLKDDLDKQQLVINDTAKRERMGELQQKFMELQQLYGKLQKELSEKEMGLTKEIFDKMEAIIAEIAQKESLTMIFEKNESRILYAPSSMDFTNDLIRKYNAKFTAGSATSDSGKKDKKK